MTNIDIFEEIFWTVADELGLSAWYELFDSEDMNEVDRRVALRFGVENTTEVEGYADWYNEMAWEL